ncbi:MAG: diaminopimelate epimerase [Cellvibrionaceae bacterium]|jgi:diaminopimelate epimerase
MLLRFTKMHGLGNDFVMIDGINQRVQLSSEQIKALADRRFGVGADQVLLLEAPQSDDADFRYRIFNADGTEVENCGNGARCFAKFARDRQLTGKSVIVAETCSSRMTLRIQDNGDVTVDMGAPVLQPERIPYIAEHRQDTYRLPLPDCEIEIAAVSMGNPHAVMLVDAVDQAPVAHLGPLIEKHEYFPQGVNAGFMAVNSRSDINLRVYERNVGETLACGTGACAAVVAGRIQGLLDEKIQVNLPGGRLQISWQGEGDSVWMTGPASTVYHGQIRL